MLSHPDLPITDPQTAALTRRRDLIRQERATAPAPPRRAARTPPTAARSRPARTSTRRPRQRWKVSIRGAAAAAAVALMVIPSILPAYAYLTEPSVDETGVAEQSTAQSLSVGGTASTPIVRDGYGVTLKPKPKLPTFVASSAKSYSSIAGTFVNDPTSAVQWPFTQGVPISSGFGPRSVAGCGFCSTNHQGLDMNPGSGTPIQAIADGVVADVGNPSGAYGVWIIIDHVIDGQEVSSMYAHMLQGSLELSIGEAVTVGQIIGAVGSTGASTGAHLHFEVRMNGTLPVDPYAWLKGQVGS